MMDNQPPRMRDLFEQLGLPNTQAAISEFIVAHRPLHASMKLEEAPFWTPQQAHFIREGIQRDAEWSNHIDSLDASLRHPGPP